MKKLKAGDSPEAVFTVAADDKAVAVYEYCNLHGLWVKEV
jgi:superoxide reductase